MWVDYFLTMRLDLRMQQQIQFGDLSYKIYDGLWYCAATVSNCSDLSRGQSAQRGGYIHGNRVYHLVKIQLHLSLMATS